MKDKLKTKLSSCAFWVSILSVVFLLVKQVLTKYGVQLENNMGVEIITSICYVLIVFGVISVPNGTKSLTEIKNEVENEIKDKEE